MNTIPYQNVVNPVAKCNMSIKTEIAFYQVKTHRTDSLFKILFSRDSVRFCGSDSGDVSNIISKILNILLPCKTQIKIV